MGAWGIGPLENDGGLDWVRELADGGTDVESFRSGFEGELEDGYIEAHGDGVLALLRVARLLDRADGADDGLEDDAGEGLETDPELLRPVMTGELRLWLVEAAQKVIAPEGSELYDAWAETPELNEWLGTTREDIDQVRNTL
ncbi:DUF4259 domain-containing protein [Zafaria sp. Z1313]|uniref:DUF4259 domain-containing protein n=1 Tax=unclassified Zafaria TaxID=2828765 RepID=UPI002E77C8FA|nr:DUF4259 domain-containing protein [Zafaria sp. J156]MEE1619906.1 DUF4259 domain-containing protein [Zafaria sp. J156]